MASSPSKGKDGNKDKDSSMNRLAIFGSLGGILSVASYLNGYPLNYTFFIVGYFVVAALLWMIIEKKSPKHVTPVLIILAVVFLLGNRCYYEISTAQTQALENQTPSSTVAYNATSITSAEPEEIAPSPATTETEYPTTNMQDSSGTSIDESADIVSQKSEAVNSSDITETEPATPNTQVELETYTNSIGMEFVRIPAGTFQMGSEDGNTGEQPAHNVTIEYDYYLGKYEVTTEQWINIMGENPSHHVGDNLPVDSVSWVDVQKFIRKLNEKEGTDKYRLPSEAEWEYACRAGTKTTYFFGDKDWELEEYAWYLSNSESTSHPVGKLKPNAWGLYDMLGNVNEWVQDEWHDSYVLSPRDGSAWEDGSSSSRVRRGGSLYLNYKSCKSSSRTYDTELSGGCGTGFRLVMEV